jgi:vacuolar-type H+-ATPase subunit H
MRGRVKGLLGGTSPANGSGPDLSAPSEVLSDPVAQRQALQVLALAQRTADDHVATAQHQAEKIRADARAEAEQLIRTAEDHAYDIQQEASKTLADARATAKQIVEEAQAHADDVRRKADDVMADARAEADEIAKTAQADADELDRQSQQQYQEIVGGLAAKREVLQQQIEALERFDREYRSRLTAFMQAQLRALWVDEPQLDGEIEDAGSPMDGPPPRRQSAGRPGLGR